MRKSSKIRLIQNLITTHAKEIFEVKYISKLYVSVEHQINETIIKYYLLSPISKNLQGKQQINSSGKQQMSSCQWNDLEGSNGTSSIYFPNVQSAFQTNIYLLEINLETGMGSAHHFQTFRFPKSKC